MLSSRRIIGRRSQRGLSIVEMMVGVAVGLFVIAVAAVTTATQLSENRRLLVDTQLQQDLRASADIITHELRRAGSYPDSFNNVLSSGGTNIPAPLFTQVTTPTGAVTYHYAQSGSNESEFGFKVEAGVLKATLSSTVGAGYQALTDESTMYVDAFTVTEADSNSLPIPCPKPCPDGTTDCWPALVVRSLQVDITAYAKSDPTVRRSISTNVRVRNDLLKFNGAQFCPA